MSDFLQTIRPPAIVFCVLMKTSNCIMKYHERHRNGTKTATTRMLLRQPLRRSTDLCGYEAKPALDGSKLMEAVFNPNNPILNFNALADQSDKDEQKDFMMMFWGAVAGLRNPTQHTD